jgi:hypothetical protein
MEVLTRVGRVRPELAVAGKVLADQARELDGRIADSEAAGEPWRLSDLVTILSAPLDGPIRVSAGAVIASRIRQLPRTPRTAMLPGQATGEPAAAAAVREPSSTLAAERPVTESVTRRVRPECPKCGADSPFGELCGACAGWPMCEGGCGRRLEHGGTCDKCEERARDIGQDPAEDGTCAGVAGPCGRPVVSLGLCRKCRVAAEAARADREALWHQSVAAVTAMSDQERAEAEARMHAEGAAL